VDCDVGVTFMDGGQRIRSAENSPEGDGDEKGVADDRGVQNRVCELERTRPGLEWVTTLAGQSETERVIGGKDKVKD
jgi:hypothetical protein